MSAADVVEALREIMETVDQAGHRLPEHRAGIRYAIVDPILWALGWSTWLPWECQPDYDLGGAARSTTRSSTATATSRFSLKSRMRVPGDATASGCGTTPAG